jgi:hypothetical protein
LDRVFFLLSSSLLLPSSICLRLSARWRKGSTMYKFVELVDVVDVVAVTSSAIPESESSGTKSKGSRGISYICSASLTRTQVSTSSECQLLMWLPYRAFGD